MRWEASRLLRLLLGRGQTRTALAVARHDAAEQVAGSMADRWRRRLGRTVVLRVLAGPTAGLKLALQARNLILVSTMSCQHSCHGNESRRSRCSAVPHPRPMPARDLRFPADAGKMRVNLLCLNLDVLLLQRIHFAANHLDLLDMSGN